MTAARIKVFSTFALRSIILELAEPFERATHIGIDFELHPTPEVKRRIEQGEPADVILIARAIAEDLADRGHLPADGVHKVARSGIGVAIRTGGSRPDIRTPESFKAMLLAARCVVYTDPASGGASGVHFADVLDQLGISQQMRSQTKLNVGTYNSDYVARGEADFAIQQIAEILPVPGVELLGPLPPALQLETIFVAATGKPTTDPAAGRCLVDFLTSPAVAPVIRRHGMEPI